MSAKLTTPTNPTHGRKPRGAQMSAVSKAVLGLVNLHPNATTEQLVDAWANMANAPSDDSTHGPARRWLGPRVNRLAGLGHVVNNKIGGGSGAMWHITALGLKTLGIEPPTATAKKRPAAPTATQQQGLLAPRGSKIVLPKTPRTKRPASTATEVTIAPAEPCTAGTADTSAAPSTPDNSEPDAPIAASPYAVAGPRICKHEPWPQKPQAATPAKPPILSPREKEIAMFADIKSRVGDELRPYTGIKSQLGSSKGKANLYGPGSTVR